MPANGIVTETYNGQFREAGYSVRLLRTDQRKIGGAAVLLKGGLGDPNSKTMTGLAKALLEVSDGELMAATVSTSRSRNPVKAVAGVSRSRKHQSQSLYGAANLINDRFHPEQLCLTGQSRGSVSVVDAALYLATHPKKNERSPDLSVVTIDGPGVFEQLDYEGHVVQGLVRLGRNCMEDVRQLGWAERLKVLGNMAVSTSLYEAPYFVNDVRYLQHIGIDREIGELRTLHGVDVFHIFHRDDIIPGAEVESEHSVVLEGGHARFMHEPMPIAQAIYNHVASGYQHPAAA